jgi:glycosyltransferase involved in cell wall biosynthesis
MADILFIHDNFPGQLGWVSAMLAERGHRCIAIASETAGRVTGVRIVKRASPPPPTPGILALAARGETELRRAQATVEAACSLRAEGFDPQLIIGHPGWGETLFLAEVFPTAKRVMYGEYYWPPADGPIGFDPEMGPWTLADHMRGHAANLGPALAYLEADRIVCPTPYQASLMPAPLHDRIAVTHDGIDTRTLRPAPDLRIQRGTRTLWRGTPLITYVSRKLEPLRGFHILMRALPRVLDALPTAEVLIIGEEGHGYGFRPPTSESWKARYVAEVSDRLDLSRVHFTGKLPHGQMAAALQASSAHVYYTYPFVLSWSLLEAMACGALIVASDTAPVRDVIVPGVNGLMGDFFNVDALAENLILACSRPADFEPMRAAARRTAEGYDRQDVCLPAWMRLIDEVLAG